MNCFSDSNILGDTFWLQYIEICITDNLQKNSVPIPFHLPATKSKGVMGLCFQRYSHTSEFAILISVKNVFYLGLGI